MPVPSSISDLSTTPASNSPAGSESPSTIDDYLRTHAAFIKQVDNAVGALDATAAKSAALAASGGSALVGYLPAGTGAVATNVQSKLREFVSVKDFGAVGDGVTDDTAAIQAAFNAAVAARIKRIVFPDGVYVISSTVTIDPYYSASLPTELVASNGTDYDIDFGRAHIKSTVAAAGTVFQITSAVYPETRYGLKTHGGSFSFTNSVEDVFRFTGSQMWMCQAHDMSFMNGSPVNIFSIISDSPSFEQGVFEFKNIVARATNFFNLKDSGGLKFVDNFTFDDIYFFGLSDSGAVVYLNSNCGLTNSRLSKIVHVGKGRIINSPAGSGFLTYCSLNDLYTETTTNSITLINSLLQNCTLEGGRAAINNTATQTVNWYSGLATGCTFNNLHITNTAASGAKPYAGESYAYYPVLVLPTGSKNNTVLGYTRGEFYNAIQARTGAINSAVGVTEVQLLTSFDYTGSGISTTGFTQVGKTIPQVDYLGDRFLLEVEVSGVAYTAGTKTIAVELRIGSSPVTVAIGTDISADVLAWKAKGRVLFRKTSPTVYSVIVGFGESWAGTTVSAVRRGTPDVSAINVTNTDQIQLGLNVKTITAGSVLIVDGTMKLVQRFGVYDALF